MTKHNMSVAERFELYVNKTEACWLWTGGKGNGYGRMCTVGRKMKLAHRVSYEMHVGPIPAGLVIDHTCRNTLCVNPDHLRAVTNKQNHEHLAQESSTGRSGVRGVFWHGALNKWVSQVRHNGKLHQGGYFSSVEEAAADVVRLRNELYTHNDLDRPARHSTPQPTAPTEGT